MRFVFLAGMVSLLVAGACGGDDVEERTPTPVVVEYRVAINFTVSVTQADLDNVAGFLRKFDASADMLILETFPPMGRATVRAADPEFCQKLRAELASRPYVGSVTCQVAGPSPTGSPDEPVSTSAG